MRCTPAAFLFVVLALPAAAADPASLDVYRSDLRFAGDRGRLDLEADFQAAPGNSRESLRVTIGTTVVVDAARFSERAKIRTNGWEDLLVRDPSHLAGGCRLRLEYRPTSGYLVMRLAGLEAAAMRAGGPAGVPVVIEVSGRTVRSTVAFVALSPRRWAWRMPGHGHVGPPSPPGDPVDPPVDAGTPPGDSYWPIAEIARGGHSAILFAQKSVHRSDASFAALWSQHAPGTSPPAVDFSKDMVLVYIGGPGLPSNRVAVGSAEVLGGSLQVTTRLARNDNSDGNTSPFSMATVKTTTMPVVWK